MTEPMNEERAREAVAFFESASLNKTLDTMAAYFTAKGYLERVEQEKGRPTITISYQLQNILLKEALEAADRMAEAAQGLSHGVDWNNGTHAKLHGYRQKLIDSLPGYFAARAKLDKGEPGK